MKILFSPVGMTDPVAIKHKTDDGKEEYNEGALLQICRHYRPDIVYVYMSKETLEYEKEDHRYIKSLELLKRDTDQSFDVVSIKRPELTDVHIFDYFLDEFKELLKEIRQKYPDAEIMVNVSSGTPVMKSALQILASATDIKLIPLQVATENKRANNPRKCNIEDEWKHNTDNVPNSHCRVEVSSNKNLLFEFNKKLLISLINSYDYHAAQIMCENMQNFVSVEFRELINAITLRYDLRSKEAKKMFEKCGHGEMMPSDEIAAEYFMVIELKVRKKEYIDFLRALTPLVLEMFYNMVFHELGIDLRKFTFSNDRFMWDKNKLRNSTIDGKFDQLSKYHRDPRPLPKGTFPVSHVLSWHLSNLTENVSKDEKLIRTTIKIREFEENVRNIAAHTMTSFSKEEIKSQTGWTPEKTLEELYCYITEYTSISVNSESRNTYDTINEKLIELLG